VVTVIRRNLLLGSVSIIVAATLVFGAMSRVVGIASLNGSNRVQAETLALALGNAIDSQVSAFPSLDRLDRPELLASPTIPALRAETSRLTEGLPVTKVSLLGPTGRVLFSSNTEEVGRPATIAEGLDEALAGQIWHQDFSGPDGSAPPGFFKGPTAHLILAPLRHEGTVVGAMALRLDTRAMLAEVNQHQAGIALAGTVLVLALMLGLGLMVVRMARLIHREQARTEVEASRRRAVAAELADQGRLLQIIADNLPALLTYVDRDLIYRFNNARYQEWFGVPSHHIQGQFVREVIGERNYALVRDQIARVLQGESVTFETTMHTLGGHRETRINSVPDRDETGQIVGYISLISDISDLKRLETELREAKTRTGELVDQRTLELQESEARFRDFAEASSDWLWECDADFRITWVSRDPQGAALPRTEDHRIVGRTRYEIFFNLDPALAERHQVDLDNRRPFRDLVYRWTDRETGATRVARSSGKPIFDSSGRFMGYRGVTADISAQDSAEIRAREAESHLVAALNSIGDWFVLWDSNDHLVLTNTCDLASFAKLDETLVPGQSFEDAVDMSLDWEAATIIWNGAEIRGYREAVRRARIEAHRAANGSLELFDSVSQTWTQITERRTRDGGVASLFTDITDRKWTELALRKNAEGLRQLHTITAASGRRGRIQVRDLLRFGAEHFGLGAGALIRARTDMLVVEKCVHPVGWGPRPGTALRRHGTPLAGALEQAEPLAMPHGEDLFGPIIGDDRTSTGSVRAMIAQRMDVNGQALILAFFSPEPCAQPFIATQRELLMLMAQWLEGFMRREQAAEELRLAKEQAEAANRTKSAFLANMSHELRTPLNAIIGFSDVMAQEVLGPVDNPSYKGYLKDIHASGIHLLEIINDILDVSKIEAGRLTLTEEPECIADLMDASVRLIRERATLAGIELDIADLSGMPKLYADGRRIKQVLLNLLSNAVKFTPKGGRISASGVVQPNGTLKLIVEDTGIGMTEDEIALALTPFGQVDSGPARRQDGTGLGLPLSRGLMALHGGTLVIESEPGIGTRVTLTLPAERLRPADEGAPPT